MVRLSTGVAADVGQRTVKLKAFLVDFPQVSSFTDFKVTLDPCRV